LRSFKMGTSFDFSFWETTLGSLSYPIKAEALDVNTLKETKAVPRDFSLKQVSRIYQDSYVEVAILRSDDGSKLSRSICTRTTRMWRQNRLKRPLLLFTNGTESYAVIVPGTRTDGEAKILWLSDNLYRTDREVIDSLRFPGNPDSLRQAYDTTFFPYERVRSEFFTGYRGLYAKIEKAVKKHLKKESSSYAQRFLGRLMFVYFLQRKGWLKKNKQFIDTIADYKKLNELFYESLNKEGTPGIPFLNGSLFEREEYMTNNLERGLFKEMDPLFKEARSFFNNYNFTVDEVSPLELEVSIDPALIGTVFENMLPEYERGSKGTFYTPRSEIAFICRRAIANYLGLYDKISNEGKAFSDGLDTYLTHLKEVKSEREVREFREKLLSLRIVDPAAGSGGFLLVIMQEIVQLIQAAEETVGWKSDAEVYKKIILPHLYGFDIEGEAIEIARLRLWLSLIIDQKEPEPLPNLDINLVRIRDSLTSSELQMTLDAKVEQLKEQLQELNSKYLNEHNAQKKRRMKEQRDKIVSEYSKSTGIDPDVIEANMQVKANIVVMNPPYVRQESIPDNRKNYYSEKYGIDKKSDLYAYFLLRCLELVTEDGVVSAICSDKWLETSYGITVQRKLKEKLIAIYGQRQRSFGADINTVVIEYSKRAYAGDLSFIYFDSYGRESLRQVMTIPKKDLLPGKWFYLRPCQFYLERIASRLTLKLADFAEVRFGLKTGANEFFYLKDISHLFEMDRKSDPYKFKRWGIDAETEEELQKEGLIYFENQGGNRFVIERKDTERIVRSPTELDSFVISKTFWLVFRPSPPQNPGKFSKKYISWGEVQPIKIKKGKSKDKEIVGFGNLSSTSSHRPHWYNVPEIEPAQIIPNKFIRTRHFVSLCKSSILADHTCDMVYAKRKSYLIPLWMFLNSTVFILVKELFGLRMGGGGAALQMLTEDYQQLPCIDITKLNISESEFLLRAPDDIRKEPSYLDRRSLDKRILSIMGFENLDQELELLYGETLEAVHDRLAKSPKPEQKYEAD
jgi:hypothetical protein